MSSIRVIRGDTGPLRFAEMIQIFDVVYWDRSFVPPVLPDQDDDRYTVKKGDRHDLLAYRTMRDQQLGYIIMERNGLRLWPNDFVPGMDLAIPDRTSLSRRGII